MQSFINRFQSFITENKLFAQNESILLAVSGGVDSVAMCHLFAQAKFNFGIAHCNFHLRGEASNSDEVFVRQLAENLNVPFLVTDFDTLTYAEKHKISTQMAARDLRYEWFGNIRQQHGFQWIATAHHLNDAIETFFYNFAKGTGIRGLQGIPLQNEHIIRPLLFATKDEILAYAEAENIAYREDATNLETKYARNKIRHLVVPVLQQLNPNFEQIAAANLQHLREATYLYDFAIAQIRQDVVTEFDEKIKINIAKLLDYQSATPTLLYEWLKPLGFHPGQTVQMLRAEIGAFFYSPTHRLVVDRGYFIIEKNTLDTVTEQFIIAEGTKELDLSVGTITLEYKTGRPETFINDSFIVYLDAEKVSFPLTLRRWQAGDYFYPLGLSGNRQKLQDFFTNQKLSRFEKERVWILTSNDAICWVVGHRMDERFKITIDTKAYWVIRFQIS